MHTLTMIDHGFIRYQLPALYFLLLVVFGPALNSCTDHMDESPYLRFKTIQVDVPPYAGSVTDVIIESNITWEISVSPAHTDWIGMDKTMGTGNDTIRVIVLNENVGNSRTATVIAQSVEPLALQAEATFTQKIFDPQPTWNKTFGSPGEDGFSAICQAPNGDYVLAGYSSDETSRLSSMYVGNTDVWVVRLNSSGDIIWTRTMGGSGLEGACSIVALSNGEFVIAGETDSNNGDVWGSNGSGDCWIVKLKANGDTAWTRAIGTDQRDWASSVSVAPDGSLLICGTTYDKQTTSSNFLVVKLTAEGQLVWLKTFGGLDYESATAILATANGGAVVVGNCSTRGGDVWVICLGSEGNYEWDRTYGEDFSDVVQSIDSAPGGYVLAGEVYNSHTSEVKNADPGSAWIFKINNNGDMEWSTNLGGAAYDGLYAVKSLKNGDCIIAGYTVSGNRDDVGTSDREFDYLVARVNATGQKQWLKTMGGSKVDIANALMISSDNSLMIVGNTQSSDGDINTSCLGMSDGWVIKMKEY